MAEARRCDGIIEFVPQVGDFLAADILRIDAEKKTVETSLTTLRYDFPLVLLRDAGDKGYAQCLSGIVDQVVHSLVKDEAGDRLTRHLLRLEHEIRVLAAAGARGTMPRFASASRSCQPE